MFNNTPSLSDIAAVTGGNRNGGDGWGDGNGWWVLIILFAIFGGWGNNGWGGNNGGGTTVNVDSALQRGFDNQGVMNKLNGIEQGICSLGYDQLAQMNSLGNTVTQTGYALSNQLQQNAIAQMQSTNALQAQLQDCCCENRAAIAQVRYDMATDTCAIQNTINQAARDITDNANANYRQIHDEMIAIQMQAKDAKIAEQASLIQSLNLAASQANQNQYLINKLQPCPVPAYPACGPTPVGYFNGGWNWSNNNNNCCA